MSPWIFTRLPHHWHIEGYSYFLFKMFFNPGFKISMKKFSLENLSVESVRIINFRGKCTAVWQLGWFSSLGILGPWLFPSVFTLQTNQTRHKLMVFSQCQTPAWKVFQKSNSWVFYVRNAKQEIAAFFSIIIRISTLMFGTALSLRLAA